MLAKIIGNGIGDIQWKFVLILGFLFILLNSDVMYRYVLSNIDGCVEMGVPTTYGSLVLVIIFVIASIILDVLIRTSVV